MEALAAPVPDDFEALKAALASMRSERDEARVERDEAQAEAAMAKAERSEDQALIAHLKLMIAKLKREQFGVTSERSSRLLDQMELQLEELEASATEDELVAEKAAARATTTVKAFARKKPSRQPFPEHLQRERVVIAAPTACRLLWRHAAEQAGRGRHRDAGGDPAPVEGDPDRAREALVPGLRDHRSGTGTLPRSAPRLGWPQPSGHGRVREVRSASAAEPSG